MEETDLLTWPFVDGGNNIVIFAPVKDLTHEGYKSNLGILYKHFG